MNVESSLSATAKLTAQEKKDVAGTSASAGTARAVMTQTVRTLLQVPIYI